MNNNEQNPNFVNAIKDIFGKWEELPTDTPYHEVIYSEVFIGAMNELLNLTKKTDIIGVSKNFCWGIIPEMKVNGIAFKKDEEDFIGVYFGTLSLQCHFTSLLFCSENFYPSINSEEIMSNDYGDSVSKVSEEELKTAFENIHQIEENYVIDSFKMPNDKLREDFVLRAGYYISVFTFLHELGHLSRGHLDLYPNNKNLFLEFDENRGSNTIDSRILEIDADKTAIYFYLKIFAFEATLTEDLETKRRIYKQIWLAITNFFLLADIRRGKRQNMSHPPPYIRYLILKKMSHNIIATINIEELKIFYFVQMEVENNVKTFIKNLNLSNIQFFNDTIETINLEKELQELYSKNHQILNHLYKQRADKS
jgi:hypothetical protein